MPTPVHTPVHTPVATPLAPHAALPPPVPAVAASSVIPRILAAPTPVAPSPPSASAPSIRPPVKLHDGYRYPAAPPTPSKPEACAQPKVAAQVPGTAFVRSSTPTRAPSYTSRVALSPQSHQLPQFGAQPPGVAAALPTFGSFVAKPPTGATPLIPMPIKPARHSISPQIPQAASPPNPGAPRSAVGAPTTTSRHMSSPQSASLAPLAAPSAAFGQLWPHVPPLAS
mmetsp:Transcript_39943/g.94069  ORF Transcript_39943/g.94069 Transcript_39943/m.94069 type:complete len:226 (-) Transcript_39943:39-716(-)